VAATYLPLSDIKYQLSADAVVPAAAAAAAAAVAIIPQGHSSRLQLALLLLMPTAQYPLVLLTATAQWPLLLLMATTAQ
jgi:hypothetical protein